MDETTPMVTNVAPEPMTTPTPVENIVPVEKPKKNPLFTILIIIVSFLAFCGILVGVILTIVNTATQVPLKASNDFLATFDTTDVQASYDSTSSTFKGAVTIAEFTTFFNTYKVLPFSDAKVTGKNIETTEGNTIATFDYTMTYQSQTYTVETQLIQENEVWKIVNIVIN